MPRHQVAALAAACFSIYWAVMAWIGWPQAFDPQPDPPMMRVFLSGLFAVLAVILWRGRPGGR